MLDHLPTFVCCEPGCWTECLGRKYCGKHGGSDRELREKREAGKLARETLKREAARMANEATEEQLKQAAEERLQALKDKRYAKPVDERPLPKSVRVHDRRDVLEFHRRKSQQR